MSLANYILNITERNVSQFARAQYERDLYVGRSEVEKRADAFNEWKQERCMSGVATEFVSMDCKLKQFVENHLAHQKDARDVRKYLDDNAGTTVFVRVGDELYEVRRSFGGTCELPVNVMQAKVIGA